MQEAPSQSLHVLSICPERHLLKREVLGGLGAQFWGQPVQSAQSLDSLSTSAPGEPTPLPIVAPSGLSRPQFLIAAQAATLPGLPSHCRADGGLVLDRVLMHGGSDSWWATLTGRAKVQRIVRKQRAEGWEAGIGDPENYRLGANVRADLGPGTIFKAKADLDARPLSGSEPRWSLDRAQLAGRAQLRHKLAQAELRLDTSINQPMFDSAQGLITAPLTVSADVMTPAGRNTALQYRAGLLHVSAHSAPAWRISPACMLARCFLLAASAYHNRSCTHALRLAHIVPMIAQVTAPSGPQAGSGGAAGSDAAGKALRSSAHLQGAMAMQGRARQQQQLAYRTKGWRERACSGIHGMQGCGQCDSVTHGVVIGAASSQLQSSTLSTCFQ